MLQHQDRPLNSAHGGRGGSKSMSSSPAQSSAPVRNRKGAKDGNFNFLPTNDTNDERSTTNYGGGDENRNQVRPRNLGPLGRDTPNSSPSAGYQQHNSGLLSPRTRRPCWNTLEPLVEIEALDDGSYGRVPPDGAEEARMEEEVRRVMMSHEEKWGLQRRKSSLGYGGKEEKVQPDEEEDDDEWGDSDSESEFSLRSGGSASSLNMDSAGEGMLMGGFDRIGVGEPKSNNAQQQKQQQQQGDYNNYNRDVRHRSFGRRSLSGRSLGNVLEEKELGGEEDEEDEEDPGSSDSEGAEEMPELMDAVWTLRDRERFKAQEMEKHQVQLTMYRRLALIRWVRTLQGRVSEQQNRLQASFDVILDNRKELLRMGAANSVLNATPTPTAVSQS